MESEALPLGHSAPKCTKYMLLTDICYQQVYCEFAVAGICNQQMYYVFAIDRRLLPANALGFCY